MKDFVQRNSARRQTQVRRTSLVLYIVPSLRFVLGPRTGSGWMQSRSMHLPPEMQRVVEVMMHYGLTFRTEKSVEYKEDGKEQEISKLVIEPELDRFFAHFDFRIASTCKPAEPHHLADQARDRVHTALTHQRVELQEAHRRERDGVTETPPKAPKVASRREEKEKVPEKKAVVKDFFGGCLSKKRAVTDEGPSKVLVEFNYQEGHTNAVRRPLFVRDFLRQPAQ